MLNALTGDVISNLVPVIVKTLNNVQHIAGICGIHDVGGILFRRRIDVSAVTNGVYGSGLNNQVVALFSLGFLSFLNFFLVNDFCNSLIAGNCNISDFCSIRCAGDICDLSSSISNCSDFCSSSISSGSFFSYCGRTCSSCICEARP